MLSDAHWDIQICRIPIRTTFWSQGFVRFQAQDGVSSESVQIIETTYKHIVLDGDVKDTNKSIGLRITHLLSREILFTSGLTNPYYNVVSTSDYRRIVLNRNGECANSVCNPMDLLRIPLECLFVTCGIVSFHAACVELSGEAVCFTGDSGAGKSTRAKAWVDGLGAEFISGDRPAIRLEEGGNVACGVPWDGKEQIFRNVERPLKAILEVRRAPFTRLRRLSYDQACRVAVRQAFIPMWDPDTAALAIANVHRLCRTTPVYRLFCGPDVDSARAVHRILFEHPEEIQEELPEMKIKPGFTLRHVVDEYMVMPTGDNIKRFGGTVILNEVSAFVFEQLQKPISREDLLALILAEFDVDEPTAAADLDALLEQFRQLELLEE